MESRPECGISILHLVLYTVKRPLGSDSKRPFFSISFC